MSDVEVATLADAAAPLDVLLVDAALGPVRRFVPNVSTAKWAVSLARKPRTTARRCCSGSSTRAPSFWRQAWPA